jgi:hypothetical protein
MNYRNEIPAGIPRNKTELREMQAAQVKTPPLTAGLVILGAAFVILLGVLTIIHMVR